MFKILVEWVNAKSETAFTTEHEIKAPFLEDAFKLARKDSIATVNGIFPDEWINSHRPEVNESISVTVHWWSHDQRTGKHGHSERHEYVESALSQAERLSRWSHVSSVYVQVCHGRYVHDIIDIKRDGKIVSSPVSPV